MNICAGPIFLLSKRQYKKIFCANILATQLHHPWESCITLANNWGFVPNDQFKPASKIIHLLIEIFAKGGSLLLGVGPKPDELFPDEATQCLEEIGTWMNKNGAAIYNTRNTKNYNDGSTWFTQNNTAGTRYAMVCLKDGEPTPANISWKLNIPKKGSKIKWLPTGETVNWWVAGDVVTLKVPSSLSKIKDSTPALAFSFLPAE